MRDNRRWACVFWAAITVSCITQFQFTSTTLVLPELGAELQASLAGQQWVIISYSLPFAVLILSAGAIGDHVGSRKSCICGFLVFIVSALGCVWAPTMAALLVSRALQGVAAALLVPNCLALMAKEAAGDKHRIARSIAIWTAVGGAAFAIGPVLSGLMLSVVGWRSLFLAMVPLALSGLAALACLHTTEPRRSSSQTFDWTGSALSILTLAAMLYALTRYRLSGPEDSGVIWGATLALLAGGAFLLVERKTQLPLVPRSFWRIPGFRTSLLFGFVINATYSGLLFVLALFLRNTLEYAPLQGGLSLLSLTGVLVFANLASGRLILRFGDGATLRIGIGVAVGGFLASAIRDVQEEGLLGLLLIPVGVGLSVPAITNRILSSVPRDSAGLASAALNSARQLGSATGVALFGGLIPAGTGERIAEVLQGTALVSAVILACVLMLSTGVGAARATVQFLLDCMLRRWGGRRQGKPRQDTLSLSQRGRERT